MSGGKNKSGSAMKWAKPYAITGAKTAESVYNANAGNTAQLGSTVSNLVPGLVAKFNAGNPAMGAASGHVSDVLSGKYLNGNPHLEQIIGNVRSGVSDEVNSQFGLSGRYGSGAHTGVLTDKLAEAESGLRYNDYAAQTGRMDQAASLAPQLASMDYNGIQEILQAAGIGAELPFTGLDTYSSALANLFNGGTQKQGTLGPIMAGIGGGLSAAASGGLFSKKAA